ncbi:TPA: hypothetical protein ACPILO_005545 [Pseudomonas aeruginosa]
MSNEDWNELDESYRSALSGALETAHPAVEQAGGDERAAFDAWLNEVTYEENTDRGVFKVQRHQTLSVDDERIAWRAWQGRALLARSEQEEMERLREAYEWGYDDGQNNPNGYSDKKQRDACVNELLKQPSTAQADEHRPTYECTMGIGGGDGNLFVHGDHASIKAAQQIVLERDAALAQPSPTLPPFAEKVLAKLRRFYDCASDFESGGVDIGRHWLDLLTQLGLLNRVQRSPALWEITCQGEDLLGTQQPSPAQAEHANSGYDQLWGWFGLSRSAYAVLPRVMMHAMPDDWQARFAELMDEWDDHWPNQPDITAHVQIKQNNRFISTPPWLLNYRHPDHNQLNAMRGKDEL